MNGDIVAIIGLAVSVIGGFAALVIRFGKVEAKAETADAKAVAADAKADATETALAAFKEHVARDYMTNNAMLQVEQRLTDAIHRVGDRLDRAFSPTAAPRRTTLK